MAGVGKLLKQAQKMQRSIESLQTQLAAEEESTWRPAAAQAGEDQDQRRRAVRGPRA